MPTRLQLDFAAAWLARDIRPFNAWHYANGKPDHLACWERATGWAPTPAGADILATIDALEIDPATARADDDPKLELAQVCATCNGSREISRATIPKTRESTFAASLNCGLRGLARLTRASPCSYLRLRPSTISARPGLAKTNAPRVRVSRWLCKAAERG